MAISLEIGLNAIGSYKRLAYTPWHAIAEFVDNSTQSYFNNKELLDTLVKEDQTPLRVNIEYRISDDLFLVEDNAIGMTYDELQRALIVANPPSNTSGRSKYGMGLKTAACWIGNLWNIRTKKLGETIEHQVTVDVDSIIEGNKDLPYVLKEGLPVDEHYTIVEIRRHNRQFKGRTLAKIGQFLSSMYRQDFREHTLTLIWQGKVLEWIELDDQLLTDREGKPYKKDFDFKIGNSGEYLKRAYGWVGVLKNGSRSNAGFSILHSNRVVKGWPQSWRPASLYGQEEGSNDLVNQRLVGEIHLDDFDVSHTKDDILWLGDEQDQVESELAEACQNYRETALTYRKSRDDRRGPSELETEAAISDFQKELTSPELQDIVNIDPMLPVTLVESIVKTLTESVVTKYKERFSAKIDTLTIKGYVEADLSPNDPYVTIESTRDTEVIIIVNAAHPHWNQIEGAHGVLNYLRHCTYDGISEWQARKKTQRIDPETIKLLKDKLLRITLDIERHESSTLNIENE
jgi:hypothetical protein